MNLNPNPLTNEAFPAQACHPYINGWSHVSIVELSELVPYLGGIFTSREGGVEHCGVDNVPVVRAYIADWIQQAFRDLDE